MVVVVFCVVVVVACGAVVVVCYLSKQIRMPKRTADSHQSMTVSPYLELISPVYSTAKHMHRGTYRCINTPTTHNPHALPVHKYVHTQYRHSHDTQIIIIHTHD